MQNDQESVAFGRVGVFWLFLKAMDDYYGNCIDKVNLPQSLLNDHMRLMPLTEMTRYFGIIEEQINDELFIAKGCSKIQLNNFSPLCSVVCSSPVLFVALIRFNTLFKSLQSGTKVTTVRSGNIVKWSYQTKLAVSQERLNDGIVAAWVFVHLLREYMSKDYSPITIHLPGSRIGKVGELERIFGCDILWNQAKTEVWFPASALEKYSTANNAYKGKIRIDKVDVLNYIDIPDKNDFSRCVYELINYSRAFGYPKLEFIADLLMMSPLALQRRLQKHQYSFSELVKFQLLYNLAPQMLVKGVLIEQVGIELGFNNPQSFTKAFKKAHNLTPKQYLEDVNEFNGMTIFSI
ncbi:AraC family transcriptional regulator [Shewanella kaireitica]|uniref:AraC family transcriptional regulator n=1 Tax=Shewanella kaireitica TaxID=212021 RepID=UPI00200F7278|nr:AraC family transcriptional regulator ligand-binding domain-containing protein [Shewanella kaireitica]MCL1093455.1 AraC family transcriptional regulator ligand-binding domain-containing protein [Shewanella kaireitica]